MRTGDLWATVAHKFNLYKLGEMMKKLAVCVVTLLVLSITAYALPPGVMTATANISAMAVVGENDDVTYQLSGSSSNLDDQIIVQAWLDQQLVYAKQAKGSAAQSTVRRVPHAPSHILTVMATNTTDIDVATMLQAWAASPMR